MEVFFLFLLSTSLGCLSTLYWIPEPELGRGYFQMNALLVLGLLGLATSVAVLSPSRPFGSLAFVGYPSLAAALVGGFSYYGAVWRQSWTAGRWLLTVALLGCLVALLAAGSAVGTPPSGDAVPFRIHLLSASLLTSALLLGWSLIAMLLGHWYLVAPRLTFRHLAVFCWVLLAALVLRLAAVGASLAAASSVGASVEPHPLRVLTAFGGQGMFFWFRLLWGLAVPLTLALMALHCARQRSNQSATGILYVLVVGTFIGEVTAYYLTVTTGVPV